MWHAKWIDYQRHCPRCEIRPTLWLWDGTSFCVNCKLRGPAERRAGAPVPAQSTPEPAVQFVFTFEELERLAVYRRAVAAGFFTDDLPERPLALEP